MTHAKLKSTVFLIGFITCLGMLGASGSSRADTPKRGLTWVKRGHDAQLRIDIVGCVDCDPYHGDTDCTAALPILCIYNKNKSQIPDPGVSTFDSTPYYFGWSGGYVSITTPVVGSSLGNLDAANAVCAAELGPDWHMAEHHDGGGGWHWWAYGDVRADSHYWTFINDQSDGNCFPLP